MNLLFFVLLFITSVARAATPDYDTAIQSLYPTARQGINYRIGYTAVDQFPIITLWTIDKSTPPLNAVLAAYNASTAKATVDAQNQALQLKLGLTATEFQELKAAVKQ